MSPRKGTGNGETTNDEWKRIGQVRGNTAVEPETADAKRGGRDSEPQHPANQTAGEEISPGRSQRAGEPKARAAIAQPVECGGEAKRVGFSEREI